MLIDDVDRRIVALLNERTRVVEDIGRVKRLAKLPIYEPEREDQVFANMTDSNAGPLTEEAVRRVFERIIDEMRKIQRIRMESDGEPSNVSRDAAGRHRAADPGSDRPHGGDGFRRAPFDRGASTPCSAAWAARTISTWRCSR